MTSPGATIPKPGADAPPRELAIPGTHERVVKVIQREVRTGARVLDIGAGQGALSKRLLEAGYAVEACELFPEMFNVPGVECRRVDVTGALPYEDDSLDAAVAVEVVEHLESHRMLFSEAARVLKPGGKLLFTTPNILSLKSRLRFLMTGYFYSFGPLDPSVNDPVRQHIAPFTLDRYRFLLSRCGLELVRAGTDKIQNSSRFWYWLAPLIRLNARRAWGDREQVRMQNGREALLGRKLVVVARKPLAPDAGRDAGTDRDA